MKTIIKRNDFNRSKFISYLTSIKPEECWFEDTKTFDMTVIRAIEYATGKPYVSYEMKVARVFTGLLLLTLVLTWVMIIGFSIYACIDLSQAVGEFHLGTYLACILNTGGPFAAMWLLVSCVLLTIWRGLV